jgi:hypothetical protein
MTNTDAGGSWNEPRAGGGETGSPKEMAQAAVQTVKQEAQSFAANAQEKAFEQVEQHKQTATQTMGAFATAIRKAGDELAQSDQSLAGKLVKQAADGLEGLSRSVSDKRPEELLDAVRDFGRRNPAAFIAGTVLLGLAIGRMVKSSEQHLAEPDMPGYVPSSDFGARPSGDGLGEAVGSDLAMDSGASVLGDDALDDGALGAADGDDRDRARFEPGV